MNREENAAMEAAELEEAARREEDAWIYTRTLTRPFQWEGRTYEKLTFQWGGLTGMDYLDIENELLLRGKTLITPEFTGEFLCGMAVRACQEKRPDGRRALDAQAMKALPLRDFRVICKSAQSFLLRAGS